MIPISSASGGLVWSRMTFCHGWELRSDRNFIGSLQRTRFWTSEFRAQTEHGSWIFRRPSYFRCGTEILDSNSTRIANLERAWSGFGGTLTFSDGQTFHIIRKGCWRPRWTVLSGHDQVIFSIDEHEKTVSLAPETSVSKDRLMLVVILAWHLIRQTLEDGTVGAMVATAALVAATA